jgi:hypothetical protein
VDSQLTFTGAADGCLAAARGILYSVLLAAAFWALIAVVVSWATR